MAHDESANLQRLSPRLRMIANGNYEVNTYRAQLSGSVKTSRAKASEYKAVAKLEAAQMFDPAKKLKKPADLEPARAVEVSCFIHLEDPGNPTKKITADASQGQLCLADVRLETIDALSRTAIDERITYIETGSPLSVPNPTTVKRYAGPPQATLNVSAAAVGQVLIGMIDVGGFDFAHPDFRDGDTTRFYRIWDQGVSDPPAGDSAVAFGRELTREEMNRAIIDAARAKVAPSDLLQQSSQVEGSHGTHVASIAGGNSGVHSTAILAGVLIALGRGRAEPPCDPGGLDSPRPRRRLPLRSR